MNCNKCNTELVIGENWALSRVKNQMYICKTCHKEKTKNWNKNNPESSRRTTKNKRESEGRGVYLVKYRWINFYVGEGWLHDRKSKHLKFLKTQTNESQVAEMVRQRNLPSKYLSFHVLEYEDNKTRMLELEDKYRRELKPYLNSL